MTNMKLEQQNDAMEVDGENGGMRFLAVFCDVNDDDPGYEHPGSHSSCEMFASTAHVTMQELKSPTLEQLAATAELFKPNFVYICGPYDRPPDSIKGTLGPVTVAGQDVSAGDLVSALEDCSPEVVYLDAAGQEKVAELLRLCRVPSVIYWPDEPQALVASHFAAAFFAALAVPAATALEAYALALHATQAHCGAKLGAKLIMPTMPDLLQEAPALEAAAPAGAANGGSKAGASGYYYEDDGDAPQLALPGVASVPPPPKVEGLDVPVPGWSDVQLMAPRAELWLSLCGSGSTADAARLAYLGEALRALLVLEVRRAHLLSAAPSPSAPTHLPPGAGALHCELRTASGCALRVILAAPGGVAAQRALVEHALRQTLASDAQSLQFLLPPGGAPPLQPRSAPGEMGGVPCVQMLASTGVWAAALLRQLAQDSSYRGLAALGVAGVGGAPCSAASPSDVVRYRVIVSGCRPGVPLACSSDAASLRDRPSRNPLAVLADPPLEPHGCGRAPLHEVSEQHFLDDLFAFLTQHCDRDLERASFPDVVVNGSQLDVWHLYREVACRGGFRAGSSINWKRHVFSRMTNWTPGHRQAGVSAALKRHYASLLWEYEQAHPGDVQTDRCTMCGHGEETGLADWIACDSCNSWVHFSCDRRQGLGDFESYDGADARSYTCPGCTAGGAGAGAGADDAGDEGGGDEGGVMDE